MVKGTTLFDTATGLALRYCIPTGFNRGGWFVGGGVENNLNIFGISAPGWFMKTEYRAGLSTTTRTSPSWSTCTNISIGRDITFKPFVQTISTSLVYRFNWTGPVVAKY